jgi:predicted kinase
MGPDHATGDVSLILFCGLPGSGKTTLGKRLAHETGLLRLCTDDWMADLGLDLNDEQQHARTWSTLWLHAWELLARGQSMIFEDGLWTARERQHIRIQAKRLGVRTELHCFEVPFDVLLGRLERRNLELPYGTACVTAEMMLTFNELFEVPPVAELELFDKYTVHGPGWPDD